MSPISVRHISKRRYTASGSVGSGSDDGESFPQAKRIRGGASPLVRDPLLSLSHSQQQQQATEIKNSSPEDSHLNPQLILDEDMLIVDDIPCSSYQSLCSSSLNENSSTEFSSRANTPDQFTDVNLLV
jgi:hypothetical protein